MVVRAGSLTARKQLNESNRGLRKIMRKPRHANTQTHTHARRHPSLSESLLEPRLVALGFISPTPRHPAARRSSSLLVAPPNLLKPRIALASASIRLIAIRFLQIEILMILLRRRERRRIDDLGDNGFRESLRRNDCLLR